MRKFVIPVSFVHTFIRVWNKHNDCEVTRDDINSGWCYQFALAVRRTFGDAVRLYTDMEGGHCWIRVDDLYYDSVHLHGVRVPLNQDAQWRGPVSEQFVVRTWESIGISGPVQTHTIEAVAKRWKQSNFIA